MFEHSGAAFTVAFGELTRAVHGCSPLSMGRTVPGLMDLPVHQRMHSKQVLLWFWQVLRRR